MNNNPTAIDIIKALFPIVKLAGNYAARIQDKIKTQPEKNQYGDNFYATALTDADLTIQTAIELAILAQFPNVNFFGEEHEKSYNTKYFKSINFGGKDELLITLDPIDGTRAYIDGLPCYSIILTVIKNKSYEAVFILQPKKGQYFYAIKNQGAFIGNINDNIEDAKKLTLKELQSRKIYLSFDLANLRNIFNNEFETYCSATDYSKDKNPPEYIDLVNGNLAGVLLAYGNLIDSAAIAFVASEVGAIVTTFEGKSWLPFSDLNNMKISPLIIAHNQDIYQEIIRLLAEVREEGKGKREK